VGLRDELLDPWGGIVAGVAGGLSWAVASGNTAAVPLGLGVAGAVYAAKVAAGALARRSERSRPGRPGAAPLPAPRRGSPAQLWLDRAQGAVRSLAELVDSSVADRAQLGPVRDEAAETVDTMRRFAGQVTAVENALARVPAEQLAAERGRLARAVRQAHTERLRAERQRSLDSVEQQLAVAGRLSEARETILARMQATALGLEGLVARTAELLALGASAGVDTTADRIAELTSELDGLRAGLAEAEEVSRRVLDG
jgi:hypothetical protein